MAQLFGVDPTILRYQDVDRYLALARVTTGEVMARVFAEFRRARSSCWGGLVWFLQDLWPGAGWGVLDSRGLPKAAYWFLKRAFRPLGLFITDEGTNGLHIHVVNDQPRDLSATLRFSLYQGGETRITEGSTTVVVPSCSAVDVAADGLLETFCDTSRAYRFGPAGHDVATVALDDASGTRLAEAAHLLDFRSPPMCTGLEGVLERADNDDLEMTIRTKTFAHAVTVSVPGYLPDENYFNLGPQGTCRVRLHPHVPNPRTPRGALSALNLGKVVHVALKEGT
jgi:beta-mannosidase